VVKGRPGGRSESDRDTKRWGGMTGSASSKASSKTKRTARKQICVTRVGELGRQARRITMQHGPHSAAPELHENEYGDMQV
jgi:hypothetical protein